MIGNGYPYRDTGFVIVEEGVIDPATFQLVVHQYRVLDKYGEVSAAGFVTFKDAQEFIEELIAEGVESKT